MVTIIGYNNEPNTVGNVFLYPKQIKLMIKSTILDMYKNTVGSILNNLLNIIARPFVPPVINSLGSKNKW